MKESNTIAMRRVPSGSISRGIRHCTQQQKWQTGKNFVAKFFPGKEDFVF